MIDIHTHILPFIDDGAKELSDSIQMIEEEVRQGVKHIILTPHALRVDINPYTLDTLEKSFKEFKDIVEAKYPIKLYLGQEVYANDEVITHLRKKQVLTLHNSNYVLLELSYYNEPENLDEIIYACDILGIKIILAHIERYEYFKVKDFERLKDLGVLFQVNSGSFFSKHKEIRKRAYTFFKHGLVSFVASDIHSFRTNTMQEAYLYIKDNFGETSALDVFYNNPKKILNID